MELSSLNFEPSVKTPPMKEKNMKAFRDALAAQGNVSTFFEKYDWRETQELLSLTTCSWLLCPEDFILQVEAPHGMIQQIENFSHTDAIILAPVDSSVPLDYTVVHQIVRELTVGIYCFNQVPAISLETNFDQSTSCQLPPAYYDTKVGQILINVDYTMKALWHGAYMPREKRAQFSELWRSGMGVDSNGIPQTKKDMCAEFLTAGLVDISDDPSYHGIYNDDTEDADPTYEPNSAEEQKLFLQHAENILLKITSYLTAVRQHENLFTFEGTYSLSGVVRLLEDVLDLGTYQRLQQRLACQVRLVKRNLGQKVELRKDLAYLKLIGFLVPFLTGLRKRMRIPDLSHMLPPISEDLLKTEQEFPPLLLGPTFSCQHFSYKPDRYFHLHGGIEFDVGTPELNEMTAEMKMALTTLQKQAVDYLDGLLQDAAYKRDFSIPLSEIDGKSYCVISIKLESFYHQHNKVQWWEAMNAAIKKLRKKRLPLSDIQLHDQFKKTFGYAEALKCKNVAYGLRAAAKRGLSATFYSLSRKISSSHMGALDEQGFSLLHHAALHNHTHIICQLAAAGINVNQARSGRFTRPVLTFSSGSTPLHLAAQCGSLEALNCLLALQADYRLTDVRGWMAVHFAAFYGQVACIQALCRKDPTLLDARTSAEYRTTPLLLAVMSGSVEALDFLLSGGANWRETDSKDNNGVQLAALYFHTNILGRLIHLKLEDLHVWKVLIEMLQSQEHKRVEMAIRCLEALSVKVSSFWKDIMEAGGIAALVDLLRSDRSMLQRMATAVMCHMTENAPVCEALVQNGAVPVLIKLLSSQEPELLSRVAVILADLSSHSSQHQTLITELCGVPSVVRLLNSNLQDVLLNAVRCVRALCTRCPCNQTAVALSGGIEHMVEFIRLGSEILREEACLALAELARDHSQNQELICVAGVVSPLVKVLQCGKMSAQVKAAYALEAIAHQNPAVQESFLNKSAAKHLLWLLKVFQQDVREQGATALWTLAGHTPKRQKQMAKLMGYHLILELLLSTSDKMQYVGCQAVIALSRDSRTHQNALCSENVVPPLVRLLRASRTTERTLLSVIRALAALCIGVAHTNNVNSQSVIYEEKAIPTLLDLLQGHESLQIKVQVSQTLACVLLGNLELQKTFWEHEDFPYHVIVDLLQAQEKDIRLEAGHALALFAYNNPTQQKAMKQWGTVPVTAYEAFLNSEDETERAKSAFQIVVLAKVITDSDQVTLTARGVTVLVELLQSEKATTIVITAQLLASLTHTRAGIPDAIVTMGAIGHLTAHLHSEEEEVRKACATALGYLTFNQHAHRLLMVKCRNYPLTYKLLMDHLTKDAKIARKFTSEFILQRRVGLPSLSLEINKGPFVHQCFNKGAFQRSSTSHGLPASTNNDDRTRSAPVLQRSRTAGPRVHFMEDPSCSSQSTKNGSK